jgi:Putative zinc-finger/WD40-like Beta Propeller Repeat
MNCEQVEELLSAYLDDALAPEGRREVAAHIQTCTNCSALLAEFSRNDALLSHLPRVSPDPALRERIFSSPEFLELTGTFDAGTEVQKEWTAPRLPSKSPRQNPAGRPQLVAIPGGRSTLPTAAVNRQSTRQRRSSHRLAVLFVSIAAVLIVAFAIASVLKVNFWLRQTPTAANNGAITPPTGPQQGGPLSAGLRVVFMRQGTLWSLLSDGTSRQADRLTPANVIVAENWVVSPAQAGSSAGDKLAYIDLQGAFVHVIRSDGQQDTIVKPPLLKAGVQPAAVWDTGTGATILNSLAWSQDGSMLAFVADPTGTGQTKLYIYSTQTGTAQVVPSGKGSVSHPVWSPDGIRLAFEVTDNGVVSILDYNTQNHGVLTITSGINSGDSVLTLDWSPDLDAPAVTWSVGQIGHVHSLWMRRVGVGEMIEPLQLLTGDYVQAIYSRNGHGGVGSWLVVTSIAGRAGNLRRIDVTPGAGFVSLTYGKQVSFAQWSSDGTRVDYLDALSSGVGTLHVVNVMTGVDSLIATGVVNDPAPPAWSADGQELIYSTGTRIGVVNLAAGNQTLFLTLKGVASAFTWFATSSRQVVVALSDGNQGIYLVNTQQNTWLQVGKQGASGPFEWTEIP